MAEKTALVLSAGGMFGAYQAGAFRTVADTAPPDIVVGASVGALNGWMIASGCTPDQLIERWLDPSAGHALKLFPNHGWRNGWFDPRPLREQAQRLYSEYRPRMPYGLVVVRLRGLTAHLVQHPNVTADHLQATCSIPLFLPSVRIDGKRYLDGGLFEKVPIWAAIEMGATKIIAVDSMPTRVGRWWLHLGINIAYAFKPPRVYPPELDLTLITPSGTLGDANDAVFWNRQNAERWIEMGARDALHALSGNVRETVGESHRCRFEPGTNPGD